MTTPVKIPKRSVYKAAEVCTLAKLQPYVLRSWEAEFPDLGVAQKGSGPRVYRQSDLDKVLRIKELLYVEGLTLGAARRKILKEEPAADEVEQPQFEELAGGDAQERVEVVKAGLRSILELLSESGNGVTVPRVSAGKAVKDAPAASVRARAAKKTTRARRTTKGAAKQARKQPTDKTKKLNT
jgi:DNA-binding transcriptional MerR regulator